MHDSSLHTRHASESAADILIMRGSADARLFELPPHVDVGLLSVLPKLLYVPIARAVHSCLAVLAEPPLGILVFL